MDRLVNEIMNADSVWDTPDMTLELDVLTQSVVVMLTLVTSTPMGHAPN